MMHEIMFMNKRGPYSAARFRIYYLLYRLRFHLYGDAADKVALARIRGDSGDTTGPAPTISINDVTLFEGNSGNAKLRVHCRCG